MTIVVVILVGAGTLLIASALDCTPIVTTFQKIVSGQSVDWSGMANQCGQQVTTTGPGQTTAQTPFGPVTTCGAAVNGKCPAGCTPVPVGGGTTVACVKTG